MLASRRGFVRGANTVRFAAGSPGRGQAAAFTAESRMSKSPPSESTHSPERATTSAMVAAPLAAEAGHVDRQHHAVVGCTARRRRPRCRPPRHEAGIGRVGSLSPIASRMARETRLRARGQPARLRSRRGSRAVEHGWRDVGEHRHRSPAGARPASAGRGAERPRPRRRRVAEALGERRNAPSVGASSQVVPGRGDGGVGPVRPCALESDRPSR